MPRFSKIVVVMMVTLLCCQAFGDYELSADEVSAIEQAAPAKATVEPKQSRKLLIFSLCQGWEHKSIPYCDKAIEIIGEKTGAFESVHSKDMAVFDSENLKQFDAVCFNNTTNLSFDNPQRRKNLLEFVKSGKAIVGIHAAIDNFYDWPDAAEMMGGLFNGHPWGAKGTWVIKVDEPGHPIVKMFFEKGFLINDEIYQIGGPYSREKVRVLLSLDVSNERNFKTADTGEYGKIDTSTRDYPVAWVRQFGKGRVFYSSLGHNPHIYRNKKVLQHYLDGIQFALGDLEADATASVAAKTYGSEFAGLDKNLKSIASYNYGDSREAIVEVKNFVRAKGNHPQTAKQIERRLLGVLKSDATLACKQFVCEQLSIVGGGESIAVLASMLTNAETSDMAIYALERIDGAVVNMAMHNALDKTSGKVKIGIINSLGSRGSDVSVWAMKKLVNGKEMAPAVAAAAALGRIGGENAVKILNEAKEKATGDLRLEITDSLLDCADGFVKEGKKEQALIIYKEFYGSGQAQRIRIAGLRGMVTVMGGNAVETIVKAMNSDDEAIQTAAISLVSEVPSREMTTAAVGQLNNLSALEQVRLITALAQRADKKALAGVTAATKSSEKQVRISALKAVGVLGDHSSVELLAATAAKSRGDEQESARASLYGLRGKRVDSKILDEIGSQSEAKVKVELIRSVSERNITQGVDVLFAAMKDNNRRVRVESIKSLRAVASPEHLPGLIELLMNVQSDSERSEAEKTVGAVAGKIDNADDRPVAVLAAMDSVKDVKGKCSLLRVLGKIGSAKSLAVMLSALKDEDAEVRKAAIRGLSEWPCDEPMGQLRQAARVSQEKIEMVLALRGFIELIGVGQKDRPVDETVSLYKEAIGLTTGVSEKRKILAGLSQVACFDAMAVSAHFMNDDSVKTEAGAAVIKIGWSLRKETLPKEAAGILKQFLEISKDDKQRSRAVTLIGKIEKVK